MTEHRKIKVRGTVQGVGMRPFVYRIAVARELAGTVLNDTRGVEIEVEGPPEALDDFERALREELPPTQRDLAIQKLGTLLLEFDPNSPTQQDDSRLSPGTPSSLPGR